MKKLQKKLESLVIKSGRDFARNVVSIMAREEIDLRQAVSKAKFQSKFLQRPVRDCIKQKTYKGIPPNIIRRQDQIFKMLPEPCNTVVEIGSQQGWFAYRLLKFTKTAKLYCVDPWEGQTIFGDGEYNFEMWKQNLKPWIDSGRVEAVRSTSEFAAKTWNQEIDFLFIDGDHTKAAVKVDLRLWYPFVRKGGLIAGHDYTGDWGKDVQGALKEFLRESNLKIEINHGPIYNYSGNENPCESWWWYKS